MPYRLFRFDLKLYRLLLIFIPYLFLNLYYYKYFAK